MQQNGDVSAAGDPHMDLMSDFHPMRLLTPRPMSSRDRPNTIEERSCDGAREARGSHSTRTMLRSWFALHLEALVAAGQLPRQVANRALIRNPIGDQILQWSHSVRFRAQRSSS